MGNVKREDAGLCGADGGGLDVWVEPAGRGAVVVVVGECDRDNNGRLREAVREALDAGCREIEVDCRLVAFIDASTVGVLLRCRQDVLGLKGTLTLRHLQPDPGRVLDITGIRGLLEAADEAIAMPPAVPGRHRQAPATALDTARELVATAAQIMGRSQAAVAEARSRSGRRRSDAC